MYARFGVMQVREGQIGEFVRIFRDSMVPPARAQKGFKGVTLLADHEAHKVIAISLWETEADAKQMATTDAAFSAQVDKLGGIVTDVPDIRYLEVAHQE